MNLGVVAKLVVPKIAWWPNRAPRATFSTRTFIPHDCHAAVGVLGAVTSATAAVLPGAVAASLAPSCPRPE